MIDTKFSTDIHGSQRIYRDGFCEPLKFLFVSATIGWIAVKYNNLRSLGEF